MAYFFHKFEIASTTADQRAADAETFWSRRMSEEMMNHGHSSDETEFEHEDLGTRGIFVFLFGPGSQRPGYFTFIIYGMYSFLDKYEKSADEDGEPAGDFDSGSGTRGHSRTTWTKRSKKMGAPMLENQRTRPVSRLPDGSGESAQQLAAGSMKRLAWRTIPIEARHGVTVGPSCQFIRQASSDTNTTVPSKTPAQKTTTKGKSGAK